MAEIIDKYCDIILVGDSVGMVLYGMKTTREVKIETLILHGKAVKNSAKRSFVVFDMPHKTYSNKFIAYKNVKKVMKSTKCDAVKLEGGRKIVNIIKYLTKKGIPVMGHIGLLPQSSKVFKLKGKNLIQKKQILQDAMALSNSGVFAIVIECVVESLAKKITDSVSVPTIGIGASKYCDGQILVTDDMIGLSNFRPRFVKKYSNVKKIIEKSVKNYCSDIKRRKFPSSQNVYRF
jgi:3-methyl-2-oxobutanoate hydroxymethyltransferase